MLGLLLASGDTTFAKRGLCLDLVKFMPPIDRDYELEELNWLLQQGRAHRLAVAGRRRLGKTTVLLEWATQSGLPYLSLWQALTPDQT